MARRSPMQDAGRGIHAVLRSHATLGALVALAAAPILVAAAVLPAPLVLPTLSLVALGAAAIAALVAWRIGARQQGDRVSPWDLAGALVLIGFVAATLSDHSHIVQLMETSVTN